MTGTTTKSAFIDNIRTYMKPKMLAMLALGFASGLPLMMVFQKLSFWLREVGIDKSTITFMYWITIAYTLKWLWSPVVDRVTLPFLGKAMGQRRSWMMVAITGTVIGLMTIGQSDPTSALWVTLLGAFILAYSGATLDISIDAWRIEIGETSEQGHLAAIYQLGYRFAIMFSGVGLAIAEYYPWSVSFGIMAAAMALTAIVVIFFISEPHHAARIQREPKAFHKAVADGIIEPFSQLIKRLGLWILPVAALVALYRLPDFTMGVMASPLYADLGYSKVVVGGFQSGVGPWLLIAGAFLGGLCVAWVGTIRTLLIGAPLTLFTTAAYAGLALLGTPDMADAIRDANGGELVGVEPPPNIYLILAIGADNIAGGFVGTAFIAYLSNLTDPKNAATQYACLSSLYAFFCKFIAGFSGSIANMIGYSGLFLLSASYAIPAALLIAFIIWYGTKAAKGETKFDQEAPDPLIDSEPASQPPARPSST
ncbi:AmpG family muropeptide MFS transporter [Ponticaulis profundi]|uniref:AmpG family muropeptide MFS transporter n=1 Tax=Ponticaulis profundi TaxID=2665222 RepID=A0ABW1S8V6_9PROT